MNAKTQAVLATYLRAAVAAVIALYLAGETDLKKLGFAAIAAVAGPVHKWLDPNAKEFGRGSK